MDLNKEFDVIIKKQPKTCLLALMNTSTLLVGCHTAEHDDHAPHARQTVQNEMLALPGDEDEIHFEFMGVSNMPDSNDMHMHEHIIAFNEKDQIDAAWILWNDGEEAERRFFPMQHR